MGDGEPVQCQTASAFNAPSIGSKVLIQTGVQSCASVDLSGDLSREAENGESFRVGKREIISPVLFWLCLTDVASATIGPESVKP